MVENQSKSLILQCSNNRACAAKSKWVIPLTYCAFQLILRPWIGKLTTSNCPFLQTIWNGLFHLVRLVVTQELYMNRKKVFWKEEISLICIQEHKNSLWRSIHFFKENCWSNKVFFVSMERPTPNPVDLLDESRSKFAAANSYIFGNCPLTSKFSPPWKKVVKVHPPPHYFFPLVKDLLLLKKNLRLFPEF